MKKAVLIFSGYNDRAVIAFLRECRRLCVDVAVIASGTEDFIFDTVYRDLVIYIRRLRALDIGEIEEALRSREEEYVLVPSTEYLNRFALRNRRELGCIGVAVPLVHEELYAAMSNKYAFGEMCRRHGLRVPLEYADFFKVDAFPVVAKPRAYFSMVGAPLPKPIVLRSNKEIAAFVARHTVREWYLQEFVSGESLYLLCYVARDGRHVLFSQRNLVQQSGGKSIVAAVPADLHHQLIAKDYLGLFEKEGFHGLVMIELRARNGEYVMIEANPRLWGPSQLFVDAGVPLFKRFLEENGIPASGQSTQPEEPEAKYFWRAGIEREEDYDLHGISEVEWAACRPDFERWDIFSRDDCNPPASTQ